MLCIELCTRGRIGVDSIMSVSQLANRNACDTQRFRPLCRGGGRKPVRRVASVPIPTLHSGFIITKCMDKLKELPVCTSWANNGRYTLALWYDKKNSRWVCGYTRFWLSGLVPKKDKTRCVGDTPEVAVNALWEFFNKNIKK